MVLVEVKSSGVKSWRYGSGSSRSIGRWDGRGVSGSINWVGLERWTVIFPENGRKPQRIIDSGGGCDIGGLGRSAPSFARIQLSKVISTRYHERLLRF
jgi:hypothetical protein